METVVQSPPVEAELHLLTDWGETGAAERRRKALVATILFHVAVVIALTELPESALVRPRPVAEPEHLVMPLMPLTELTQKAPNRGKVMAEFQVQPSPPRPRLQAPPLPPPTPRETPRPAVIPQAPPPKSNALAALPEAPRVDPGVKPPVKSELPPVTQAAPPQPQIQAEEKPKIVLENAGRMPVQPVAPGRGLVPMPRTSLSDAMQDAIHGRGAGGTQAVGDPGAFDSPGFGGAFSRPSPGVQGAGLELVSDPLGVDFRPYLIEILAIVRRNWTSVIPESVHMGLRGKVELQLAIVRDGEVAKLTYALRSGAGALDQAAVAGVSASNPLPPLPAEFKGDRIVVQFNFVYNMPRQ
jgi:TonB family protein